MFLNLKRITFGIMSLAERLKKQKQIIVMKPIELLNQYKSNKQSLLAFYNFLCGFYKQPHSIIIQSHLLIYQITQVPHIQLFLKKDLPYNCAAEIKEIYAKKLVYYLKNENINKNMLYFIGRNLQRIIFEGKEQLEENQGEQIPQYIIHACQVYLAKFTQNIKFYEYSFRHSVLQICKHLKLYNHEFTENIKFYVQRHHKIMSLQQVLLNIAYLFDCKSPPYEFFYTNKLSWFGYINGKQILLKKNEKNMLRLLEILTKQRLAYSQREIEASFKIIKMHIDHLHHKDIIRVLYYYSKSKYKDQQLVEVILKQLEVHIQELTLRNLKYLLISLGNLKFKETHFINQLKINTQLNAALQLASEEFKSNREYYQELTKIVIQT